MKKWGSCRENLQLWPHFLTPVPFLWMINLCVVQRSHVQYDSHRSAENATSSPKIPQLSIYCYHLTSHFHGQMISHTSSSLELNLKLLYFFWKIYALLLSQSHLCTVFSLLVQPQLVGRWSLRQAPSPRNGCLLKIQEIDHLYNNHIKLEIIDLFVIHPITGSAIVNQLNFYRFFYLNKRNYDFKSWL